ncbi:hypothetical protein T10_6277 [Trichinella papuae]|uniref:Uncharacterized protein n=2 Tax=Trichinella papuae TaxID=268474 RepID=A0A0V1LWE2_9BILA|nr:hypothetical protein T10_6277 [Trichinella papuae]
MLFIKARKWVWSVPGIIKMEITSPKEGHYCGYFQYLLLTLLHIFQNTKICDYLATPPGISL